MLAEGVCVAMLCQEKSKNGSAELVSIIMPTYNCAAYIDAAIASVQAQTYENWELIIIDDASTDQTARVIQPFLADRRILYHRMERNQGPAAVRNQALCLAKGAYIAFLDSDDLWLPEKLERQISFMQQTPCAFSCTAYQRVDEQGRSLGVILLPYRCVGYWREFFLGNVIGNSTVIYDRRRFGDVQVPDIRKRNDFALWLELLREGERCFGIEEPLMQYRVRENSVSAKKWGLLKYHWQLYRQVEEQNIFISALGVATLLITKGTKMGQRRRKCEKETQKRKYAVPDGGIVIR